MNKQMTFTKYMLIQTIAGLAIGIASLAAELKVIPIPLLIFLVIFLFAGMWWLSSANKQCSTWDIAFNGWRLFLLSFIIVIALVILTITVEDKYDYYTVSAMPALATGFALKGLFLIYLGKKYEVDKLITAEAVLEKHPEITKWLSKSFMEKIKQEQKESVE